MSHNEYDMCISLHENWGGYPNMQISETGVNMTEVVLHVISVMFMHQGTIFDPFSFFNAYYHNIDLQ